MATEQELHLAIDRLNNEDITVVELLAHARREMLYCCDQGCGDGACESCPCCGAGWCVAGTDGLPESPEDRERWLPIAAEYNPIAAELLRVTTKETTK